MVLKEYGNKKDRLSKEFYFIGDLKCLTIFWYKGKTSKIVSFIYKNF